MSDESFDILNLGEPEVLSYQAPRSHLVIPNSENEEQSISDVLSIYEYVPSNIWTLTYDNKIIRNVIECYEEKLNNTRLIIDYIIARITFIIDKDCKVYCIKPQILRQISRASYNIIDISDISICEFQDFIKNSLPLRRYLLGINIDISTRENFNRSLTTHRWNPLSENIHIKNSKDQNNSYYSNWRLSKICQSELKKQFKKYITGKKHTLPQPLIDEYNKFGSVQIMR